MNTLLAEKLRDLIAFAEEEGWKVTILRFHDSIVTDCITLSIAFTVEGKDKCVRKKQRS